MKFVSLCKNCGNKHGHVLARQKRGGDVVVYALDHVPVDCPSLPYRAASTRRQAAAVRSPYGFTGATASTILFSEDL